jgi:hypothetical protein
VTVRLELNQDGTLAREPVVLACVPVRLPVARYDMWKVVEVRFDMGNWYSGH